MAESSIQRLIRRRDKLLLLVHEFNMMPARYIHFSWMENIMPMAMFEKLRKSHRAEMILSKRILAHLSHDYVYDFEKPSRRLALLPGSTLETLIYLTGISLLSPRINKLILGKQVMAVKNNLGPKMFDFAIKRAPILMNGVENEIELEPENFDYRTFALDCGARCIEQCLSDEPSALTSRFQFKFPKKRRWNFSRTEKIEEKNRVWSIVERVLLQEVAPEWKPIFS